MPFRPLHRLSVGCLILWGRFSVIFCFSSQSATRGSIFHQLQSHLSTCCPLPLAAHASSLLLPCLRSVLNAHQLLSSLPLSHQSSTYSRGVSVSETDRAGGISNGSSMSAAYGIAGGSGSRLRGECLALMGESWLLLGLLRLHLLLPPSGCDPASRFRCQAGRLRRDRDRLALELHVRAEDRRRGNGTTF